MRHFASPAFWDAYLRLPDRVRDLADKNYALLKSNPKHPSLHFKKIGRYWSVRVGIHHRALGVGVDDDVSGSGSARMPITTISSGKLQGPRHLFDSGLLTGFSSSP
jgi:hypothetical protein